MANIPVQKGASMPIGTEVENMGQGHNVIVIC